MSTLPTAFIATQRSRVRLDAGTLVVEHPEHAPFTLQLGHIGALVILGAVEVTIPALLALADRGIGCALASRSGRMRASLVAPSRRHRSLRGAQQALETMREQPGLASARIMDMARHPICAKLDALIGILTQHQRTHVDVDLTAPLIQIRSLRDHASRADSIDRLRGFEGAAMACYFSTMPALCRTELTTSTRSRRPPQDPINAALSFGYSLLVNELTTTLYARGLDPGFGIMHPPVDGRPSLALDLVEPLRHAIVDRLVLRAANRGELQAADFERCAQVDGSEVGTRFTDAGRGRFLKLYHDAMSAGCTNPSQPTPRSARSLLGAIVEAYETQLIAEETPSESTSLAGN